MNMPQIKNFTPEVEFDGIEKVSVPDTEFQLNRQQTPEFNLNMDK